eukprot:scaffold32086_cov183-Amphora_coffeaeformis.AAC.22
MIAFHKNGPTWWTTSWFWKLRDCPPQEFGECDRNGNRFERASVPRLERESGFNDAGERHVFRAFTKSARNNKKSTRQKTKATKS